MTPRLPALVVVAALVVAACTPEPAPLSDEESALSDAPASLPESAASGCSAERSCGKPTLVCKRPDDPRPCGAAGCVDMQFRCSTDSDCLEGYACHLCRPGDPFPCPVVPGRCRPRSCARDSDCGSKNLACQAGSCAHKTCRKSSACKSYCVAGSCWDQPGWCFDTTLPPPP